MNLVALLTSYDTGTQEDTSVLSYEFHVLFCDSVSLQQNFDFPINYETLLLIDFYIKLWIEKP